MIQDGNDIPVSVKYSSSPMKDPANEVGAELERWGELRIEMEKGRERCKNNTISVRRETEEAWRG